MLIPGNFSSVEFRARNTPPFGGRFPISIRRLAHWQFARIYDTRVASSETEHQPRTIDKGPVDLAAGIVRGTVNLPSGFARQGKSILNSGSKAQVSDNRNREAGIQHAAMKNTAVRAGICPG